MRFRSALTIVLVLASAGGARMGRAQVPGVTISNDGVLNFGSPLNLGYSFIVQSPTSVVSLGVFQYQSNGLVHSHQIGLWDSNRNLLASAFVPAGTAGILVDNFRYTDITPISLTIGSTYYVAATYTGPFNGDDFFMSDPSSLVAAPMISYDSRRYGSGSALVFPEFVGTNSTGYWGGNVLLEAVTAVPEPASLALFATGFFSLVPAMLRKRKK